jgi:hypothetical protein
MGSASSNIARSPQAISLRILQHPLLRFLPEHASAIHHMIRIKVAALEPPVDARTSVDFLRVREGSARMQYALVVEYDRVRLAQRVAVHSVLLIKQRCEARERVEERGRRVQRERRLERWRVVRAQELAVACTWVLKARKLDGRVRAVHMVAVIDVMEGHGGRGEQRVRGRIGSAQRLSGREGVNKERGPALDAVADGVQDLEGWWNVKVPLDAPCIRCQIARIGGGR